MYTIHIQPTSAFAVRLTGLLMDELNNRNYYCEAQSTHVSIRKNIIVSAFQLKEEVRFLLDSLGIEARLFLTSMNMPSSIHKTYVLSPGTLPAAVFPPERRELRHSEEYLVPRSGGYLQVVGEDGCILYVSSENWWGRREMYLYDAQGRDRGEVISVQLTGKWVRHLDGDTPLLDLQRRGSPLVPPGTPVGIPSDTAQLEDFIWAVRPRRRRPSINAPLDSVWYTRLPEQEEIRGMAHLLGLQTDEPDAPPTQEPALTIYRLLRGEATTRNDNPGQNEGVDSE